MSEVIQSAPDKKELPKSDRSAEGVSRAISRIADALYRRAEPLYGTSIPGTKVETTLDSGKKEYIDPKTGKVYKGLLTRDLDERDRKVTYARDLRSSRGLNSFSDDIETGSHAEDVRIFSAPDQLSAEYRNHINGSTITIKNPESVGRIAANSLNVMRSRLADVEIAYKKEAEQKMVDLVNKDKRGFVKKGKEEK